MLNIDFFSLKHQCFLTSLSMVDDQFSDVIINIHQYTYIFIKFIFWNAATNFYFYRWVLDILALLRPIKAQFEVTILGGLRSKIVYRRGYFPTTHLPFNIQITFVTVHYYRFSSNTNKEMEKCDFVNQT
jgi:hypothetical protein